MTKIHIKRKLATCFLLTLFIGSYGCSNKKEAAQETDATTDTTTIKQDPMNVEKADFGKLEDGTAVSLFTLTNANGVEVKITNYGGIVTSVKVPDKSGTIEDVVLGFDSLSGYTSDKYLSDGPYFGALIGRYGNRIANGKFTLDGKEYDLAKNNGPNHLHGGKKGFNKVVWDAEKAEQEGGAAVKLHYVSKDMEEGYPGNLTVDVVYTLTDDNELQIDYKATTDKKTVLNLTNHSYFNLTGNAKRDILDHEVMINADQFVPVDKTLIPTGELKSVEGTPFDFTTAKAVGKNINDKNEQLAFGNGYDHCWVVKGNAGDKRLAASVYEPNSGRFMEVYTTEPGVQFYTGNFLDGMFTGKNEVNYKHRYGLCLETEHYPDSPNQDQFPSVVLNPGDTYHTQTSYKFSVK